MNSGKRLTNVAVVPVNPADSVTFTTTGITTATPYTFCPSLYNGTKYDDDDHDSNELFRYLGFEAF